MTRPAQSEHSTLNASQVSAQQGSEEAAQAPTPARAALDTRVRTETLVLLFQQSMPAMYFSLGLASLMVLALWWSLPTVHLLIWYAAIVLAFVLRATLFFAWRRAAPNGDAVLDWRWPYLFSLMFGSLVWGLGGLWLMPADSLLLQAVIYVFLIAKSGSALTAYSAVRVQALTAFSVTLLPAAIWFLLQGDAARVAMGLGGVLFLVSALRATRILSEALQRSIWLTHELHAARAEAENAARTDSLTGLPNRRAFVELGAASLAYCLRHGQPISVLVLDLDHFKQINDRFGHAAGDLALGRVGGLLREFLRQSDVCGRVGGEEFGVVMPNAGIDEAQRVAERVRIAIAETMLRSEARQFGVTVSIGIASGGATLEELLRRADAAMYRAKAMGRNRSVREPDVPESVSDVV